MKTGWPGIMWCKARIQWTLCIEEAKTTVNPAKTIPVEFTGTDPTRFAVCQGNASNASYRVNNYNDVTVKAKTSPKGLREPMALNKADLMLDNWLDGSNMTNNLNEGVQIYNIQQSLTFCGGYVTRTPVYSEKLTPAYSVVFW